MFDFFPFMNYNLFLKCIGYTSFSRTTIKRSNGVQSSYIQVKRTLGQFTPAQWDKDEWHPLLGPWRFIQVLALCIVFLTVELNTFFLKYCLWVPPRNPVIVYRLVLWWLIAIPTMREYNVYLQDRFFLLPFYVFLCFGFMNLLLHQLRKTQHIKI